MRQLAEDMRKAVMAVGWAALVLALATQAQALPGDVLVQDVPLPVPLYGVSMAADCDGNIYYTGIANVSELPTQLIKMDKSGALLGVVSLVKNTSNGPPLGIDEMTWDGGRNALWGIEHRETPLKVYRIDPVSGVATFVFVAHQTAGTGMFRDGIALDGSDDSLWISGDVSTTIERYSAGGTFLGQITPHNAGGVPLGSISGVVAGMGDVLYVGHNPFGAPSEIYEVRKSDGLIIQQFALSGNRVEGLECDPRNFAPNLGLLSREFGTYPTAASHLDVFELEHGSCGCAGGGSTGDDDDDGGGNLPPFNCDRPVDGLTMTWDGFEVVRVKAWKGLPGSTLLGEFNPVIPGQTISLSGYTGSPNEVTWEVFRYGSGVKLGDSVFDLSCGDNDMNGPEDCAKRQGNGKKNKANLLNDWLFDGMVDRDEILDCTP